MSVIEMLKGTFGTTAIESEPFNYDGINSICKEIKRYSSDEEHRMTIHMQIITSKDNKMENIHLYPIVIYCGSFWYIDINFTKCLKNYYLEGRIGSMMFRRGYINITKDEYVKLRDKTLRMCDPNYVVDLEDIINLLRSIDNADLREWLITWDEHISAELFNAQLAPISKTNS